MTDQPARIHSCGKPMYPSVFSNHTFPPQYRSQPIWSCGSCNGWEPRAGWHGDLPEGWDGQQWIEGDVR
jgi:hypothetical protein